MTQNSIDNIIVKFIEDRISEQEIVRLKVWLEDEDNKAYFNEFIEMNHLINSKVAFDHLESLANVKKRIKPKLKNNIRFFGYAAAASIALLLSITYFFNKKDVQVTGQPIIVNNTIKVGTDKATLTLSDGETIALIKGEDYHAKNISSNGEAIVYKKLTERTKPTDEQEIAYNYLTIPRGGQFKIQLADSTVVWLNSESQLKYPVAFVDGETRNVELVYGEAYFEVSPSTKHKGSKFNVFSKGQDIEVIGTQFNVKAYNDEANVYTTLVEGKVKVSFETHNKILKPGEQSNLNAITKVLNITNVDVYDQISWKEGVFSFKRKSLKEIMQVLSRWYDMKVEFENNELESAGFNGVVGKEQSIQEILETIKNFGVIKNYKINNKTITLK